MKKLNKILACGIAAALSFATVSCGGGDNGGDNSGNRPVDFTKNQLWIYNIENAVGSVWLDSAVARFEEKYKDYEFENGTKGVQVTTFGTRGSLDTLTLRDQPYQVVIDEGINPIDNYDSSAFYDMTSWVTSKIDGEDKSIADKMNADVKAAYTVRGGYYVLPNANSYSSPTYNKKLFDEKGLYFADSIEELYASSEAPAATDAKYGILLRNKTAKKSCGPDGVYNTVDDGLPSSVEEYKQLVDCMVELGIMPYVAYASTYHYTNKMLLAMWANLEGYEGTKLYVGRDSSFGTTEIISLDSDNNVIMEGGEPKTETLTLETPSASSNGYLIERQASKYYALDFYEHIFGKSNIDKYYDVQGLSSTVSQIDVQRKFVESELGNNTPVAFLMDGTYWENESKDAGEFKHLQKDEPDYYDELDYRVFPLPNQYKGRGEAVGTADENGVITYFDGKSEADVKKQVLVDNLFTGLYVNKAALYGADGKSIDPSTLKITELFIKFIHSDESLSEFTGITGMKKIYDYDISAEDYAKMSDFSKSVIDLGKVSDVLLPVTNTTFNKYNSVVVNMTFQTVEDMFSSKNSKGDQVRWAINGFRSGMSLNEYFKGIAEARDKTWWQGLNF